jgi:hypothetical protein
LDATTFRRVTLADLDRRYLWTTKFGMFLLLWRAVDLIHSAMNRFSSS